MFSRIINLLAFKGGGASPSLQAAIYDAMYFCMMVGLGETYLGAFGIFLGGSSLQIGLLTTLPPLCGALSQLIGLFVFRSGVARKKIIVRSAALQGIVWFFVALLAGFYSSSSHSLYALMTLAAIYFGSGNIGAPAWNSLIGDLVPPDARGHYFGFRNQRSGIVTVLSMLFAGGVLNAFRITGAEYIGYFCLFTLASFARLSSAHWLNQYAEPGYQLKEEDHFSLRDFIRRTPSSNFAKFVFFFAAMNGASAISSPYFSIYMFRDLKLNYIEFSIITSLQLLTQYVFMQNWGRLTDEFGNRRVLSVCAVGISFSGVVWLISSQFWFLILAQMYSGLFWAGFNLSAANFLFDAVSPQKRAQCAAYMTFINAVFVCTGALLGGLLVTHLPPHFVIARGLDTPESIYFKIFLLSGILRMSMVLILLPKFREVREVTHIRASELIFRITNVRPISGVTFSFIADSIRRKKE